MPASSSAGQGRRVFVVHGRDRSARDAVTALLKAFDLKVITWRDAAAHAGGGTPYTGDIVAAGMDMADAVVVLLTPDDIGYVRPMFRGEDDQPHEAEPTGQARLNVIFEAGMAVARDRNRVVLVAVGNVRKMSDIEGLNLIRMHDGIECRKDLAQRLRSAGLAVDDSGEEWRTAGNFNCAPLSAIDLEPIFPDISPAGTVGRAAAEQVVTPAGTVDQAEAEYLVLRHIEEHFAKPNARRLNTPFAVAGMSRDQVADTLRDLAGARPSYITGISVPELDYPAVITGLSQRGHARVMSQLA
jgi:predicted nucleotide-binding protein